MAMVVRLLSHTIPGPQIAMVRFAIGVGVVLGFLAIFRADLRPRRWGWVISRGIFGGTAVLLYFLCSIITLAGVLWSVFADRQKSGAEE